ncbi:MAG: circadian clock protein KaiC [Ignavibacteriae bacterium]|nr:MAG: circadian clock protein KaiC [Ignavibacteriota bacterium]
MNKNSTRIKKVKLPTLKKSSTGINGFDEITLGGLPQGRPTLVSGAAGCGKTLFAMEFLVRGVTQFNEPGVFIAFEENAKELTENAASLGFELEHLIKSKKLIVDFISIDRSEIEETGEYDLEALFIRIDYAIRSIGAKRIVLDTLEALFSALPNDFIIRAELRRLFRWLKDRGMTAIITAEKGVNTLTRHGLEEYVSDCVIVLDHRVSEQISTRRLRVLKYRGSKHGTNEYPFLIDDAGFTVMPITSVEMEHKVSNERVSTGVKKLDDMLGGKGYFRGSSVLISGTAGTGKTSLAASAAIVFCSNNEKCIYVSFEESKAQIIRNMGSIGLDLKQWESKGLLKFYNSRATHYGIEMHLAIIYKMIVEFKPGLIIIDPLTTFLSVGTFMDVKAMVMRLVDYIKNNGITAVFTSLTSGGSSLEETDVGISSLIDTWLLLKDIEQNGERNRGIYILKSRGMRHSNQVREFLLTDNGIILREVYLGSAGVLTGSSRIVQEKMDEEKFIESQLEIDNLTKNLQRHKRVLEVRVEELKAEYESMEDEVIRKIKLNKDKLQRRKKEREQIAESRKVGANGSESKRKGG